MRGSSELRRALLSWRIWVYYSLQDIQNRYSRSVIGPFWITLSMAVTIFAMGPLYAALFGQSSSSFTVHLATGIVFWAFVSGTLSEACTAFISNESIIKQTRLSKFVFIFRIASRNILVLMHNILIPVVLSWYFGLLSWNIIYLIPVLAIVSVLLIFFSVVIAFLCSRFRDLIPLINNLLQLAMFMTPVFWIASDATRNGYLKYNIFFYIIEAFRAPFFGNPPQLQALQYIAGFTILCFFLSAILLKKYSHRVVYWI